jgi:hypothetical protein
VKLDDRGVPLTQSIIAERSRDLPFRKYALLAKKAVGIVAGT